MYLQKAIFCILKHARQTCPHEYLNPEDLPQNVCILNQLLHISAVPVFSGEIQANYKDNGSFLSLATALNLCFANTRDGGIFICKGSSVAIFSSGTLFHIFDPHARDSNGNVDADGHSVLLTVSSFSNLQALLRKLFRCESAAFELYTISLVNVEMMTFVQRHVQRQNEDRCCLTMDSIQPVSSPCQTCHTGTSQTQSNNIHLSNKQETVIKQFHSSVNTGPSFVCKSCSHMV